MQTIVYNILLRAVSGTCYHVAKIWAFTKIKSMKGQGQLSDDFP